MHTIAACDSIVLSEYREKGVIPLKKIGKVYGVILAGGSGTRMNSATPKQFLPLGGVPIFIHSVRALLSEPQVEELWIGSNGDWLDLATEQIAEVFGNDPRIYTTTIKEIVTDKQGNVKEVVTVRTEFDENGKMKLVQGSEENIKSDIVIIAAGFTGCRKYVADSFGAGLTARGNVMTKSGTYNVHDNVFAAGDMRRGQSLVVWAIYEGESCAKEVDRYLMG